MRIFKTIWIQLLERPIYNLLILFVAIFGGNLGIAIVLLTLLIRLLLIKVTSGANNMQKWMGDLQPKLNEIQEKYKDNPEKMSQETMKVFKKHGAGPLKWCIMMLVQIPIFISLYYVMRRLGAEEWIPAEWLYSFLHNIGFQYTDVSTMDTNFFGLDLFSKGSIVLAILTGIGVFFQTKLTSLVKPATPKLPTGAAGQKMPDMSKMTGFMGIFMAIMMLGVTYSFPAAVGLYLLTTTLFSIGQYAYQYRSLLYAEWLEFRNKGTGNPTIIEKK